MASKSVYIADTWVALQTPGGPLPGTFSADGTVYTFPRVVVKDRRGATRHWEIRVQVRGPAGLINFNCPEVLRQPVPDLSESTGFVGLISTDTWHEGGELHQGKVPTEIKQGRNLGKKNATNVATQALRDALGSYNKQLKSAGVQASTQGATTASGLPCNSRPYPMLVKKINETAGARLTLDVFRQGVTVQRKINGVRAVAFIPAPQTQPLVFYSRKGGEYPGMPELAKQGAALLAFAPQAWAALCKKKGRDPWKRLSDAVCGARVNPEGPVETSVASPNPQTYLDGELYLHGKSLQWISGQSRGSTGGSKLEFWVYDCFFPALHAANITITSATRQQFLDLLFAAARDARAPGELVLSRVRRVENFPVNTGGTLEESLERVHALAQQFVSNGFEGAIARKDGAGYRYGTNNHHSDHLVKIKPRYDAEFPVVGYTQGDTGKDVGAVIWICEVPIGRSSTGQAERFNVVPKNMSYADRYKIFRCLGEPVDGAAGQPPAAKTTRFERDFLGKPLTVEYPELSSKTGKPTQAKALAFRTYEPERGGGSVEEGPVFRLLRECE